jgi:inhibitor of KinA
LLLLFGSEASDNARLAVQRATLALSGLPAVKNLHPAYASLLVEYDPRSASAGEVERLVLRRLDEAGDRPLPPGRLVEIPVRYDGPDLADVARLAGLTEADVVRLHASVECVVRFLGFSPGFAYLSGMPPEIAVPRLAEPRRRVPAGSVAIGGSQTGVYPVASPGGWRIIGTTGLRLFRPEADPPALLAMGDRVRFVAVDQESRG